MRTGPDLIHLALPAAVALLLAACGSVAPSGMSGRDASRDALPRADVDRAPATAHTTRGATRADAAATSLTFSASQRRRQHARTGRLRWTARMSTGERTVPPMKRRSS